MINNFVYEPHGDTTYFSIADSTGKDYQIFKRDRPIELSALTIEADDGDAFLAVKVVHPNGASARIIGKEITGGTGGKIEAIPRKVSPFVLPVNHELIFSAYNKKGSSQVFSSVASANIYL